MSDEPLSPIEKLKLALRTGAIYIAGAAERMPAADLLDAIAEVGESSELPATEAGGPPGSRVRLENLVILGDLDLRGRIDHGELLLKGCRLNGDLILDQSRLVRVSLAGSQIARVSMCNVHVTEDVDLVRLQADVVDLCDVHVEGRLVLSRAVSRVVDLNHSQVIGKTHLDGLHAGKVTAAAAELRGGLNVTGAYGFDNDVAALLEAVGEPAPPPDDEPAPAFNWELVVQFVGIGAGLAAWVAIVGGAQVWARLHNAGVPALPTLAGLGQEWMVVQGLQTLTFPVVLGLVVALGVYFSRPVPVPPDPVAEALEPNPPIPGTNGQGQTLRPMEMLGELSGRAAGQLAVLAASFVLVGAVTSWSVLTRDAEDWQIWLAAGLVTALLAAMFRFKELKEYAWPSTILLALLLLVLFFAVIAVQTVMFTWLIAMVLLTVAIVWVALGALHGKSARGAALTLFIAIVAWSGTLGFFQEAGAKDPDQDRVRITFAEDGSSLEGSLLGVTPSRIYVAMPTAERDEEEPPPLMVVVVDTGAVSEFAYAQEDRRLSLDEMTHTPRGADEQTDGEDRDSTEGDGNGGSTPGADPGDPVPPDQPGEVEAPTILATIETTIRRQQVQFQVLALAEDEGFLTLDARVVNRSGADWTIGTTLSEDGTATASGIEVFDPGDRSTYPVARKGNRCACTAGLDLVTLQHEEWFHLTAIFRAPRSDPKKVTLVVPGWGVIRGVAIG